MKRQGLLKRGRVSIPCWLVHVSTPRTPHPYLMGQKPVQPLVGALHDASPRTPGCLNGKWPERAGGTPRPRLESLKPSHPFQSGWRSLEPFESHHNSCFNAVKITTSISQRAPVQWHDGKTYNRFGLVIKISGIPALARVSVRRRLRSFFSGKGGGERGV